MFGRKKKDRAEKTESIEKKEPAVSVPEEKEDSVAEEKKQEVVEFNPESEAMPPEEFYKPPEFILPEDEMDNMPIEDIFEPVDSGIDVANIFSEKEAEDIEKAEKNETEEISTAGSRIDDVLKGYKLALADIEKIEKELFNKYAIDDESTRIINDVFDMLNNGLVESYMNISSELLEETEVPEEPEEAIDDIPTELLYEIPDQDVSEEPPHEVETSDEPACEDAEIAEETKAEEELIPEAEEREDVIVPEFIAEGYKYAISDLKKIEAKIIEKYDEANEEEKALVFKILGELNDSVVDKSEGI